MKNHIFTQTRISNGSLKCIKCNSFFFINYRAASGYWFGYKSYYHKEYYNNYLFNIKNTQCIYDDKEYKLKQLLK